MTDTTLDLPTILASHKRWLAHGDGAGSRADLSWANLISGGHRSDGYPFFLTKSPEGEMRVSAGCPNLSIADARAHWEITRGGSRLGVESLAIVDHFECMAKIAGWFDVAEAVVS